ncbi:MAG: hypothetical protein QG621_97 [Patescibacteria group bacterium]|nr:hypothetical protein [Patescibacteria group bacterium]
MITVEDGADDPCARVVESGVILILVDRVDADQTASLHDAVILVERGLDDFLLSPVLNMRRQPSSLGLFDRRVPDFSLALLPLIREPRHWVEMQEAYTRSLGSKRALLRMRRRSR